VTLLASVVGADGYPGGWIAVTLEDGHFAGVARCASFADVLRLGAAIAGVDIPIGVGPRRADGEARRFVGPRASSVFPSLPQAALDAESYPAALAACRTATGKGISKQAWMLRAKILEVQAHRNTGVIEVHPEVSFRALAGRTLPSKHAPEGLAERRHVLATAGLELPEREPGVPEVDLLDAAAVAWSAWRALRGEARTLPPDPGPGEPTITY